MCKSPLHSFLAELPKCEHHLHLEGCLSPKLVFELAAKNNIELPSPEEDPTYESPETLAARYERFGNLEDFLQCYYRALKVLVTPSDFEMLAWEYFTTAFRDGVRHAEVFFDPQSHTSRGISFETVMSGFQAACTRAESELGITSRLIMCFLRHLPASSAAETLDTAIAGGYLDREKSTGNIDGQPVIHGLGLDSSEVGFRPELFTEMFAEGKRRGIRRTAHAGEEGDPTYIAGALDSLHAERIDHGIRLAEDPVLMRRVAEERVMLTVCPMSNLCLQVVQDIAELPIRTFLAQNIPFSINSDDPAYFRGYILKNYCAVQDAFELSIQEWAGIAEASIAGSWVPQARKSELRDLLNQCVMKYSQS